MTAVELLTHAAALAAGAGPTLGLVVRERAKRQTAEAQALVGAVAMAKEALERAAAAEKKADECESGRDECEKRTRALHRELLEIRRELETSGALKSDPERPTPPEVVEAWNEKYAEKHIGAEKA